MDSSNARRAAQAAIGAVADACYIVESLVWRWFLGGAMRKSGIWVTGVVLAGLLPAAAAEGAMEQQAPASVDVYGAWASYDGLDEDLTGVGIRIEGVPGHLLLRLEAEALTGQDTDLDVTRTALGLGAMEPWTDHTAIIGEVGMRYLNPDEDDWGGPDEPAWGSSRTDATLEVGLRSWTAGAREGRGHFRTDLRGVVLYPSDSDASSQAGGRLEVSGTPGELQHLALLGRAEVLSDESHAAIGIRGRF